MIEVLQEITNWGDEKVSNHTYIVKNKTSLIGYIPKGSKKIIEFKKPLSFSKSRRKFIGKNTIVYRENLLNMGVLKYEEKIFSKTKNEQQSFW